MTQRALSTKHPDAVIIRACELRERGLSVGQIAMKLGMKPATVNWHCIKHGAEPPKARQRIYTPRVIIRHGKAVRPFTEAEDVRLLALARQGIGTAQISRELNRNTSSVRNRLMLLARHQLRQEAAQ